MPQAVPARLDLDVVDPAFETVLAAERLDGAAHVFHDGHQPEGADVRLGDGQDFRRRAGRDEFGEHLAPVVMGIPDLARELAVGKQAGPALAELHVGFRVEHGAAPQAPGVLGALAHDLAALQDERAKPHLRQHQSRKQAAWAGPDDHRPRGRARRRAGDEAVIHVGGAREAAVLGEPLEQRCFVGDLDVHRIGQRDRAPLAGIGGATEHGKADEIPRRNLQPPEDGGFECAFLMVERQFHVGQTQQAKAPSGTRSAPHASARERCRRTPQAGRGSRGAVPCNECSAGLIPAPCRDAAEPARLAARSETSAARRLHPGPERLRGRPRKTR